MAATEITQGSEGAVQRWGEGGRKMQLKGAIGAGRAGIGMDVEEFSVPYQLNAERIYTTLPKKKKKGVIGGGVGGDVSDEGTNRYPER